MLPDSRLTAVRAAFERCQRRFPTIRLTLESFAARVEEVLAPDQHPGADSWLEAFAALRHEDLFLALACVLEDRVAWEYFVDEYLSVLKGFAARAARGGVEADDLVQDLLASLMSSSDAEKPSRLAGYNGTGSLAAWLRVIVAHAAIDRLRRANRQVSLESLEETGTEVPAPSGAAVENADLRLDARWGPVVSKLLEEEIVRLPARDRLILALYHLRGVRLEAIGRHFGVHESTASRWLADARGRIRKNVERELRRRGVPSRELHSVWRQASEAGLAPLQEALSAEEWVQGESPESSIG
jgi:RNA polymerase sigma-70 factor (ECF subfamily)